jgi:hypothetical protein
MAEIEKVEIPASFPKGIGNGVSMGYLIRKGGTGSGNFGHAGRPGEVGGSKPGSGAGRLGGGYSSFRGDYSRYTPIKESMIDAVDRLIELAWGDHDWGTGGVIKVSLDDAYDSLLVTSGGNMEPIQNYVKLRFLGLAEDDEVPPEKEEQHLSGTMRISMQAAREIRRNANAALRQLCAEHPLEKEPKKHIVGVDTSIVSMGYLIRKGGPGSGNFGHAGRPGEIGGSRRGEGGAWPSGRGIIDDFEAGVVAGAMAGGGITDTVTSSVGDSGGTHIDIPQMTTYTPTEPIPERQLKDYLSQAANWTGRRKNLILGALTLGKVAYDGMGVLRKGTSMKGLIAYNIFLGLIELGYMVAEEKGHAQRMSRVAVNLAAERNVPLLTYTSAKASKFFEKLGFTNDFPANVNKLRHLMVLTSEGARAILRMKKKAVLLSWDDLEEFEPDDGCFSEPDPIIRELANSKYFKK